MPPIIAGSKPAQCKMLINKKAAITLQYAAVLRTVSSTGHGTSRTSRRRYKFMKRRLVNFPKENSTEIHHESSFLLLLRKEVQDRSGGRRNGHECTNVSGPEGPGFYSGIPWLFLRFCKVWGEEKFIYRRFLQSGQGTECRRSWAGSESQAEWACFREHPFALNLGLSPHN